jgi:hypothetical protein
MPMEQRDKDVREENECNRKRMYKRKERITE